MLAPCFDCPVFISREDDEIDRLKIFLNHLISKMRYHYKQSKQYSRSLEEKVNRRTVELREMADDLIAANLKTQMIVDNVAEGIVVVDSNNLIIQFNQKAKENLFINVDIQIFGSKFEEILADKSIAEKIINVIEETKSSQKGFETELFYEVNDSKKHLWVRTTIVDNEKLEEFFVILLIRDITNEKIVDNFKNDFFHMISHDLKNPLSSVIGFLDLLLQGSAKDRIQDKQRKYLEIASKSAGDLKKMLDDLSTIIKMQSHEIKLDKNLFYLQDLFEEVKQSFYPLFIQKNVDFKYKVTPDDLKIKADYHRLKQVLSNLIGNSIKSGNDIDIRLEAVKISSNIIIVVEDNGEGIPPDKIPLLFERFTQFFKYQDASQGLGLGLSIVKNIINLHNGYINVDSQVNKGTKFTITLPYNG
jgi:two-component system phosphate regulon sensor histidine kinase PhoR